MRLKRHPPARRLSRQKGPCPHPPPPPASEGLGSAAISLRRSAHPKAQNDDQRTLSSRRRRRDAARGSHLASTRWRYAASLSLSDGRGRPERSQGPCRRSAGLACPKPLKDLSLSCIMSFAIRPRLSLQSTTPPDMPSPPRGEEPDDDFVSFPATAALAAQIAEGRRLYARLENGRAYGEDEQTPNDLLNEPNL